VFSLFSARAGLKNLFAALKICISIKVKNAFCLLCGKGLQEIIGRARRDANANNHNDRQQAGPD
jgi:hypothetical protein